MSQPPPPRITYTLPRPAQHSHSLSWVPGRVRGLGFQMFWRFDFNINGGMSEQCSIRQRLRVDQYCRNWALASSKLRSSRKHIAAEGSLRVYYPALQHWFATLCQFGRCMTVGTLHSLVGKSNTLLSIFCDLQSGRNHSEGLLRKNYSALT